MWRQKLILLVEGGTFVPRVDRETIDRVGLLLRMSSRSLRLSTARLRPVHSRSATFHLKMKISLCWLRLASNSFFAPLPPLLVLFTLAPCVSIGLIPAGQTRCHLFLRTFLLKVLLVMVVETRCEVGVLVKVVVILVLLFDLKHILVVPIVNHASGQHSDATS